MKPCASCGGWSIALKAGLCNACLYNWAQTASGDLDQRLCEAIAKVKAAKDYRVLAEVVYVKVDRR